MVTTSTQFEQLQPEWQKQFIEIQEMIDKQDTISEEIAQHSFSKASELRNKMKTVNEVSENSLEFEE